MLPIRNYKSPIVYICLSVLGILFLIFLVITVIHKFSPKTTVATTHFDLIRTNDEVMIDDDIIHVEMKKYKVGNSDYLEYVITDSGYISDIEVTLCPKTVELLNNQDESVIHSNSWLRGIDTVPNNV